MRNNLLEIGVIVRQRRELLKLLQPQLATISGISVRTLQLLEKGKGNPSLKTIMGLAETLGLELKLQLKDATT